MLQNLSSYRVGKSYKFDIVVDKGVTLLNQLSEVLEKGNKKLKLKFTVNEVTTIDWFSSEQLSLPEVKKKEQPKKVTINVNAKPSTEGVVDYNIKNDKIVSNDKRIFNPVTKNYYKVSPIENPEEVLLFEKENLNDKLESENVTDHWYVAMCVLRDLRGMLRKIGVPCDKNELVSDTMAKVKAHLKK